MDRDSQQAPHELLASIASWRDAFAQIARMLLRDQRVSDAHAGMDVRRYDEAPTVELFVEAELGNGTLTYWVDVVSLETQQWRIDASVRQMRRGVQVVLLRLDGVEASTIDGLAAAMSKAIEAFSEFDLALALDEA